MEQITVTIPYTGPFDKARYVNIPCYLEEALEEAGYKEVTVYALGRTRINGKYYRPKRDFNTQVLADAFAAGKSVTVTLVPK